MSGNASDDRRLIIPALGPAYASLAPIAETLLRVIAGLALVTHGYGKILEPLARIEMVESLGFVPGELWSPLLAITEFFGGLFLACGFLTRPAALGTTIVLLVTVWFHWGVQAEGYSGAEKSILWAAITFFFLVHGGGKYSVDRAIGREL
ncbi:MAG TPA: DoxX family protein [Gammaproteobacteria bacterium]|nr:DoxX family protein [Gammaproteobacteria bacterium]